MKTLLLHAPEKKGLHTPRQSRVENVHIFWIAAKGKSADPEVAGQIFAPPLESPLWGSGRPRGVYRGCLKGRPQGGESRRRPISELGCSGRAPRRSPPGRQRRFFAMRAYVG